MTIRIGINPLTWTNDDLPSLGASTPLSKCLSEGKLVGYAGFELGNKFPRESEKLNQVLDEHELALVSGWYSGKLLEHSVDDEIKAIEDHLQLLKQCGAKVMVYCEVTGCIHGEQGTPLSKRPTLSAEDWQGYGKRLSKVADYCLSQGVQLAYHHHMGTIIETSEEIDLLMDNTGESLGLLLDAGHLTFAGGDPVATYKKYSKRVVHIHLKDVRYTVLKDAKNRDLSFLDSVLNGAFTVPGDGDIDFLSLFIAIRETDYNGWLVVEAEQDPAIADPLAFALLGFNNIQRFAQEAGINLTSSKN